MTNRGWRIAAASTIGTSHIKNGMACQDNHACRVMQDASGESVVVLVASDGAGSASRADEGSFCACCTIIDAVEAFLARGNKVVDLGLDEARNWIEMVQQAIALQAKNDGAVPRDYACTVLVAVVADEAAAFLQIGDGAIVATDETGEWTWIHWPQRGDYANTTYFTTEDGAVEQMEFNLIRRPIDDVALFTDGIEALVLHYATKTVHSPFFDSMFAPVWASKADEIDKTLSTALDRYLKSPKVCERTDDDKTLILASRRQPASEPEVAVL